MGLGMITEKMIFIYRNVAEPTRQTMRVPGDISKEDMLRIVMSSGTLLWFFGGRYYMVPQPVMENSLSLLEDMEKIEHPLNGKFSGFSFTLSEATEVGPVIIPLV